MTQYVQLSSDTTRVITWYASAQPITSDKPGYVEIVDDDPRYAAWQAEQAAKVTAVAAIRAGLSIVSTATPALNGTYAINDAAKANIDGIYSGIKSGDGLPGGGSTFNYPDITGAMHNFDAASFSNLAKAVRDYLYSLSQGAPLSLPLVIA